LHTIVVSTEQEVGTRKLMCTPNVQENNDDNRNGKNWLVFPFNCVLRDDEVSRMYCRYIDHDYTENTAQPIIGFTL
jgi:hypothetical protein